MEEEAALEFLLRLAFLEDFRLDLEPFTYLFGLELGKSSSLKMVATESPDVFMSLTHFSSIELSVAAKVLSTAKVKSHKLLEQRITY